MGGRHGILGKQPHIPPPGQDWGRRGPGRVEWRLEGNRHSTHALRNSLLPCGSGCLSPTQRSSALSPLSARSLGSLPPLVLRDTATENTQNSVRNLENTFKGILNRVQHWTQKTGEKQKENQLLLQIYHQVLEVPEGENRGKGDGPHDDPGRFPTAGGLSCQTGQAAWSSAAGKGRLSLPEPPAQTRWPGAGLPEGEQRARVQSQSSSSLLSNSLGTKEVGTLSSPSWRR